MAKAKYDVEKIREAYDNLAIQGEVKFKDFYQEIIKKQPKISKGYATSLYYKYKKEGNLPAASTSANDEIEQKVPSTPPKVESVSGSEVKIENTPEKEESEELKQSYKNMFEELNNGDSSSSSSSTDSVSASNEDFGLGGDNTSASASEEGVGGWSGESSFDPNKIDLSGIASTLSITFWGFATKERPLSSYEQEMARKSSEGLGVAYGDKMISENAPIINYLAFGYAIPAINRMDIIAPKVIALFQNFSKGIKRKQVYQEQEQAQGDEQQEKKEQESENEQDNGIHLVKDWNNLTQQAQFWIEDLSKRGYKIDPNYSHGLTLDVMAMRDLKILRNVGSNYR